MREIKFRAWDVNNGYMITSPQSIANTVKKLLLDFPDSGLDAMGGDYPNGKLGPTDRILMEFTGCKDINNNGIYEGDLGRINLPDIGYVNCICEWNEAGFRWKKLNEMQAVNANPSTSWSLCVPYFEVIGNIYQNPELLAASVSADRKL